MIKNVEYTSIKRVLDNLLDHPLLRDVSLEQAVRHTLRFVSLFGFPSMYEDKIAEVEIHDFRGALPCDLVSIEQVRDLHSGRALRSMTDTFNPALSKHAKHHGPCLDLTHNVSPAPDGMDRHCCHPHGEYFEGSFKTQGRIIYTSFPEGKVEIAYSAIPVDDDGYPKVMDNEVYLAALEAYIKKQVFTVKYDTGKISAGVLQNAQQDYAFLAGELQDEMTVPSESEMESITRLLNTMVLPTHQFDEGFKHLGDREHIRRHANWG